MGMTLQGCTNYPLRFLQAVSLGRDGGQQHLACGKTQEILPVEVVTGWWSQHVTYYHFGLSIYIAVINWITSLQYLTQQKHIKSTTHKHIKTKAHKSTSTRKVKATCIIKHILHKAHTRIAAAGTNAARVAQYSHTTKTNKAKTQYISTPPNEPGYRITAGLGKANKYYKHINSKSKTPPPLHSSHLRTVHYGLTTIAPRWFRDASHDGPGYVPFSCDKIHASLCSSAPIPR